MDDIPMNVKRINAKSAKWKYPAHQELRAYVYEKFNYQCCHCGTKAKNVGAWNRKNALLAENGHVLELDHIVPISKGGRFTLGNLQVLCSSCNAKKGSKL